MEIGEVFNPSVNTIYPSLADVVGFNRKTRKQKLGQIKLRQKIKEAVICIPVRYKPQDDTVEFFRLDDDNPMAAEVDRIFDEYVLPPRFYKSYNFEPIVMYAFEFSVNLSEIDLSFIWQNMMPQAALDSKLESITVTDPHTFKGIKFDDNVRFMVFKAKQKSLANKVSQLLSEEDMSSQRATAASLGYNWPYDYFSLVELGRLEIALQFGENDETLEIRPIDTALTRECPPMEMVRAPEQTLMNITPAPRTRTMPTEREEVRALVTNQKPLTTAQGGRDRTGAERAAGRTITKASTMLVSNKTSLIAPNKSKE